MTEKEIWWEDKRKEMLGRNKHLEDKMNQIKERESHNNNKIIEQNIGEVEGRMLREVKRSSESQLNAEMERMRRTIELQDRRDKKDNMIIRGLTLNKKRIKQQMESFFKEIINGDVM